MAKENAYNPWKDMREVYIPKQTRGEQSTLEVGVNDRTFFVPKDQWTEVPAPVWEVVEEMLRQRKKNEEYLSSNPDLTASMGKQ